MGEGSGKALDYFDEESKEKFTPHVIEPSIGLERLILALICSAYAEDEVNGEKRNYLAFHPSIAPGAIGRRYRRNDEIGVPFCVTVDFDTIEKDGAVTVRERDTTEQVRIPMEEVMPYLGKLIDGY